MAVLQIVKSKGIKTWLMITAFTGRLFCKQNLQKLLNQLCNPDQSDERKAFSAAFGVFMGIIPIWGFQSIAAISLSVLFKLNKAFVVLFSQVSFPLFIPFIMYTSYETGGILLGNNTSTLIIDPKHPFHNMGQHLGQYIFGSIALAIMASAIVGLLMYAWLKFYSGLKQNRTSIKLEKALQ